MADTKISALPASTTPLTGTELVPIVQGGATKQVSVANLTVGRSVSVGDFSYTGTLTGSTGVINIGSGQFYKSAGGNIGVGNTAPGYRIDVSAGDAAGYAFRIRTYAGTGAGWIQWTDDPVSAQVAYIGVDATTNPTFKINVGNVPNMSFSYTGNATVDTGNLVIGTAAKGVNFTANTPAAGMTSQLLNWYEQGTWTPSIANSFNNYTHTIQVGRYTRVGNLVTVQFTIAWTTTNAGGFSFVIDGLPFTPVTLTNYASGGSIGKVDRLTTTKQVMCQVESATASIKFYELNTGAVATALASASWNVAGSANLVSGTVTYQV